MVEDLKSRIAEDTKHAMRSQDKARLGALRLVAAAIKQVEVDERRVLNDDDVIGILDKMLKQRRESLEQFQAAKRTDLADQEAFEIDLIQGYMPSALSESEISQLIEQAITQCGAAGVKDMGKVMGLLKSDMKGRADMRVVSERVKAKLS